MTDTDKCIDCHYYRRFIESKGWCRRNPPTHDGGTMGLGVTAQWPTVHSNMYCGEFKSNDTTFPDSNC